MERSSRAGGFTHCLVKLDTLYKSLWWLTLSEGSLNVTLDIEPTHCLTSLALPDSENCCMPICSPVTVSQCLMTLDPSLVSSQSVGESSPLYLIEFGYLKNDRGIFLNILNPILPTFGKKNNCKKISSWLFEYKPKSARPELAPYLCYLSNIIYKDWRPQYFWGDTSNIPQWEHRNTCVGHTQ